MQAASTDPTMLNTIAGTNVATRDTPRVKPGVTIRPRGLSAPRRVLLHMPPVVWAYVDISLLALATYIAHRLLVFGTTASEWVANPWLSGATSCGCMIIAGIVFGLYERKTLQSRSRILLRSTMTLVLGLAAAHACIAVLFYAETSRWLGLVVMSLYLLVAIPLRLMAHEVITNARPRVLCVGSGDSIRKMVDLLSSAHRSHYQVSGHVVPPGQAEADDSGAVVLGTPRGLSDRRLFERRCPRLGTTDELDHILRDNSIDELIVGAELTSDDDVGVAVMKCLEKRCRVTDQPTFVEKLLEEVPSGDITAQWFMLADLRSRTSYEVGKRVMDVAASLVGLALTLPLWPIIALLIKFDSRGSVIYKQSRVGLHGRLFWIYKFRTMRSDAERDGARWAARNDTRVTVVGRVLRKTRLDELPQLWNILRGDMALVGPRPERPEFVEQLSREILHYKQRHLIKPGLTGWAQIHYRYGASVADAQRKLCYDLYYLKHRTIELDVGVIIRTAGTVLLGSR